MGRDMMRLRRGILLNTPHEESASGAVASFKTDVSKLKGLSVAVEPVQDLNGYANPWPPGGGANILPFYSADEFRHSAGTSLTLTTSGDSYTVSGTATEINNFDVTINFPAGTYTLKGFYSGNARCSIYLIDSAYNVPCNNAFWTVANNSKTFTAEANLITMRVRCESNFSGTFTFKLMLVRGSTAPTAYSPYSNVCPISGWSEAKVYDDPKYGGTVWWNQQCAANNAVSSYSKFGLTAKAVQGKLAYDISGTYSYSSGDRNMYVFNKQAANVMTAGHKYLVTNNSPYFCAYVYGAETPAASVTGNRVNVSNQGGAILSCTASGGYRISLHCGTNIPNGTQIDETVYINLFDLTAMFGAGNEPSTVEEFKTLFPNDYYAYNAGEETLVSAVNGDPYRAVTISLDGTRYGGSLDVLTGVLTVDRVGVDLGTLSYTIQSSASLVHDRFTAYLPYKSKRETYWTKGICSCYPVTTNVGQNANDNVCGAADQYVYIVDTDYTDKYVFKSAMSGQTFVYDLASPFTVQLTPTQLRALKGQNNIFADCGDTAVKYWKHGG